MDKGKDFAFPCHEFDYERIKNGHYGDSYDYNYNTLTAGLTKREYFAGLAMQGYLSLHAGQEGFIDPEIIAKMSVNFADALLKQLS